MKILVTGGAGFIGSNFILYWIQNHPEDLVVNFDKLTYAGNLENLVPVETNPMYKFIQGDICKKEDVEQAMQGVDTVVHFAAESHVDRSIAEPSEFLKTNVVGTQVLLDTALQNNISKFHAISTDEVFGELELGTDTKFAETTPYNPRSPYSASKAGSDHIVRAYHSTYGLPITITNCSNNFGPYQFPEKFIPLAITNILEGKSVPVYGDGLYTRDWLHVEDHCRAIEVVLLKGKVGGTYCVGGMREDIDNITIARKIVEYMEAPEDVIEFVKDRPGHDRRYAVNWSKIHDELGWEPQHSFDEWLGKTIEWYTQNEDWWRPLKGKKFQEYYKTQYEK